ncbi:MAG: hypothetical protein SF066_09455 [Thermoanaerobaculia bacterium]|nr:hypothetical protein [Thermoanaerobaculia bacterium]
MRPLHLALSADPPVPATALLRVLEGLARQQSAVAGELLLAGATGSPLEYLRRLQTARHRRRVIQVDRDGAARARRWAAKLRARRPKPAKPSVPSLAFARGLLELAEEQAAGGHLDAAFELALEAEAEVLRARELGLVEHADRRDVETRAYVLCGRLFRKAGQTPELLEVVRGLEADVPAVARTLRTEARVLTLRALTLRDAGQFAEAEALLLDALELLATPFRIIGREVLYALTDLLTTTGHAREAAVLLTATAQRGREFLDLEISAELHLRAAEAWLAGDRPRAAARALDRAQAGLETSTNPAAWAALHAGRAEYLARTGLLAEAEALWGLVHAESPRGSVLSVRAVFASLEIAIAQSSPDAIEGWLEALDEDLRALPPDSPDRRCLTALRAVLGDEPTLEPLADARAYLRHAEESPGLAFQRPWPGARRLVAPK